MFTATKPSYPNERRPESFETGLAFQDFVCSTLARDHIVLQNLCSKKYQIEVGENLQGFEIKFDERSGPGSYGTGNLSIELYEKSRADMPSWTPSGILRDDNTWLYIQGNYRHLFIFSKKLLRQLWDSGRYPEAPALPTIRKFHLPWKDAVKYCAKLYEFHEVVEPVVKDS
jgi:hypothetical protein